MSGKTAKLLRKVNREFDGGALSEKDGLLVKHPRDDRNNPGKIGKYKALETEDVDEVFKHINAGIDSVFISGISHFDSRMERLVDALIRSNRRVTATGINLHSSGKPYGIMPELMAIADDVEVSLAHCNGAGCDGPAAMSLLRPGNGFEPVCYFHYMMMEHPDLKYKLGGWLELDAGPMYSGKTTEWEEDIKNSVIKGQPHIVVKHKEDTKGGQTISKHSGDDVRSKIKFLKDGKSLTDYVTKHPEVKTIFIDEGQFFEGIYDAAFELVARGYRLRVTGLPRPFYRKGFKEMPSLMCLAERINYHQAVCKYSGCKETATENQRIINDKGTPRVPDVKKDPVFFPGDSYEARCLRHLEVLNEDENPYKLEKFERRYD